MEEPRSTTRIRTRSQTRTQRQCKRQKLSSDETNYISNLPTDLLLNILIKLPIISIRQCQFVCKQFRNTIIDPRFAEAHYEDQVLSSRYSLVRHQGQRFKSNDKDKLVVIEGYKKKSEKINNNDDYQYRFESSELKVGEITGFNSFKVVNSCRGFLLIRECARHDIDRVNSWFRFSVYNPLTNEHCKVPGVTMTSPHSFSLSGLSFSHRTNQFKVVKFVPGKDLAMHTVGSSEGWRTVKIKEGYCEVLAKIRRADNSPLELNGALHWLPERVNIASFDVEKEEMGVISTAPCVEDTGKFVIGMCMVQGLLCLGINSDGNIKNGVEMWVMKEYGVKESWTKFVVIRDLGVKDWWNPTLVHTYDDGIVVALSTYPHSNLVVYDPKKGRSRTLRLRVKDVQLAMTAQLYIPSLFTIGNSAQNHVA